MMRFAFVAAMMILGVLVALDPLGTFSWAIQAGALFVAVGGWLLMERWEKLGKI